MLRRLARLSGLGFLPGEGEAGVMVLLQVLLREEEGVAARQAPVRLE